MKKTVPAKPEVFQDHGGDICLEMTQPGRTIFRLTLPKEVCGEESVESRVFHNLHDEQLARDGTKCAERVFAVLPKGDHSVLVSSHGEKLTGTQVGFPKETMNFARQSSVNSTSGK